MVEKDLIQYTPGLIKMNLYLKKCINGLLARVGLVISRTSSSTGNTRLGYISAKETISSAELAGLSVGDYVEALWGVQGGSQAVVEKMASSGAFLPTDLSIVEIGTGTGRYLEKVLAYCSPAKYESYETARDWAEWLQFTYPIVSHQADGYSLKHTPTQSADLVHAHGVFVYLPFIVAYRYWIEIWRVTKERGVVVFDIYSEECFDQETMQQWINSNHTYPCFLSKQYIVGVFGDNGFRLVNTFMNRHGAGHSEYLVFVRD